MALSPDFDTICRVLKWCLPTPESVIEVRGLTAYRGQASVGYFNNAVDAANAICAMDNSGMAGFYATINPVLPDTMARCANRMVSGKAAVFTSDKEILERRGVVLDFDPIRVSGISSTDEEHQAALDHAQAIANILITQYGFPSPCVIDSGNGAHLRYQTEALPNTPETTTVIRTFLRIMNKNFSTDKVEIDKTIFNAARIIRIPGTIARKGEDTQRRPHRMAKVLRNFDPFDSNLTLDKLKEFNAQFPDDAVKPRTAAQAAAEYPPDETLWRGLNKAAKSRIHDWVPHLLGDVARPSGEGYRIDSDTLGRELEEAISIIEGSIKDFGEHDQPGELTEGRRTAVTLVSMLVTNGDKKEAAERLALILNMHPTEFGAPILAPLPVADQPVTMPADLLGGAQRQIAEFKTFREIRQKPLRRPTYAIDRLIAWNAHTVFSGPPKAGKTTLMYKILLHMLFGRPIFGRQVQKANVLHISLEEREDRLHWKIEDQLARLKETEWRDLTQEEEDEAFSRWYTICLDSAEGGKFDLPRGPEGADKISHAMMQDPTALWFVMIEPIGQFHRETSTRNLNKMEYEQIEIINNIVQPMNYKCAILTIKHDRKMPPGGIKGVVNMMDNISGSVAQQGAPDAQIQFYTKDTYSFNEIGWLMVQSRDFGKVQIPLVSDGISWTNPPPDMEVPEFQDYLNSSASEVRGSKKQDPRLAGKIVVELAKSANPLSCTEIANLLNIESRQIVDRELSALCNTGQVVIADEKGAKGAALYFVSDKISMPRGLDAPEE